MASIAGFVIGSALASDLSDTERMRMGLVGALMPSPLVGALIVESLVEPDAGENAENDLRALESICEAVERVRGYDQAEARRELIAAVKDWLDELERDAHDA
jgi:hypothetical protein